MTEQEWLTGEQPVRMLDFLTRRNAAPAGRQCTPAAPPSDRKLRLLLCAISRLEGDHDRRRTDIVAEHEEMVSRAEAWAESGIRPATRGEHDEAWWAVSDDPLDGVLRFCDGLRERTWPKIAALLCEILGNPFRPVALPLVAYGGVYPPSGRLKIRSTQCPWLTPDVRRLASHAYLARDFTTLPILADALEEAGCVDPPCWACGGATTGVWARPCLACPFRLLAHLRSAGPHVRGCWALDVILQKH